MKILHIYKNTCETQNYDSRKRNEIAKISTAKFFIRKVCSGRYQNTCEFEAITSLIKINF